MRILVTIRSAMNQTAPINCLPPETLTRALEFREDDKDLISATHVCQRWRSALSSSPSLWTNVVFRDSHRVLTYLTRSKTLPIDVSFKPVRISFEAWKFSPKDLFISRIPWVDRVKSLHIRGDEEHIEAITRRLCLPAPLLQHMKFDGIPNRNLIRRTPGAVHFPHNFLGGQAPSLQSLSFESISPTPIITFPLSSLTSLTWIDRDSTATVKDLLTILTSAPLLEVMTVHLQVRSVSTAERMTVVTLDNLRELSWSNSGGTFSLMSCLIAPELRCLNLRVTLATNSSQSDLASILPPHGGHFPLLVEPTEMRYASRSGTRWCHFTSATSHIGITVVPGNCPDVARSFNWLSQDTPISFRRTKQLVIEEGYPPLGGIPIEQFESLESLELVGGANICFSLLRPYHHALSDALVAPFPTLLKLQATSNAHLPLDPLAVVLRERKQAGYPIETARIRGGWVVPREELTAKMRESVDELVLELAHT
jgi:hypothetical protein